MTAVDKANQIVPIAHKHGWVTKLVTFPTLGDGTDHAVLEMTRNDEWFKMVWKDGALSTNTDYRVFNENICYTNIWETVKAIITGWPDVVALLAQFPDRNPVEITKTYVHLPFSPETDGDEVVWLALLGKRVWWYDRSRWDDTKHRDELVREIMEIKHIGHRRLVMFKAEDKMKLSFFLDQVLKVENT